MKALKFVFFLLFAAATVWSFRVPNAELFQTPELARIIFFHLPCAFVSTFFFFWAVGLSVKYLAKRDPRMEHRAEAANELAMNLFALTMITGILFSKVQWGAYWQGDPRQTSFLLVLLMQGAYFLIRMAFSDEIKRANAAAVYNVACLLPVLFLIFVYPRLPQTLQLSSHPSQTLAGGMLKGDYAQVFGVVFVLLGILAIWLYRMRVRAGDLELILETKYEQLDARGASAATGVVRPVSVSDENGNAP